MLDGQDVWVKRTLGEGGVGVKGAFVKRMLVKGALSEEDAG